MRPKTERNQKLVEMVDKDGKSLYEVAKFFNIHRTTALEIYYREKSRKDKKLKVPPSLRKYTWQQR